MDGVKRLATGTVGSGVSRLGRCSICVAVLAAFAVGLAGAASGSSNQTGVAAGSQIGGILGCNLGSPPAATLRNELGCPEVRGADGSFELAHDTYVGHDEPEWRFISTARASGNSMTYKLRLPADSSTAGATPAYQTMIAFWLGMPLCDPASYPQQPCHPDSDSNTGTGELATDAGSAVLEMQFYPPGFPTFANAISCDTTHWCAAQVDWSLECTLGFKFCNKQCTEIPNFAFVQKNGVPTGPPSPQLADLSTFMPNAQTLLMNPGDTIRVSIHDTPAGLFTGIDDLTNGTSGFMIASADNGYMNTNVHSCKGTPFSFHPEYSSASTDNIVPWTALQLGPGLAVETGHYESPDGDADDANCPQSPTGQPACISTDADFDGVPYQPGKWATGFTPTATTASALAMLPLAGGKIGPVSRGAAYPSFELESIAGFTMNEVSNCDLLQPNQCSVDELGSFVPTWGGFYPFYSAAGCTGSFGDVTGAGVNDFGGVAGYGPTIAGPVPQYTKQPEPPLYGVNAAVYTNSC
jgi:hypothetical protein